MSKPTVTATTATNVSASPGEVVELGVTSTGKEPVVMYADGLGAPLRLTPGPDGDQRAFLAARPGTTRVTASAGAARPVEFTITTTAEPAAVEPVADIEKE